MAASTITFGNCRYKVPNLSAAKDFYAKAFDAKPYFDEPTWIVFQINDHQLWLEPDDLIGESVFETTDPFYRSSKHSKLIYWAVEDVHVICNRFRELGGTIYKPPKKNGPFTDAIAEDPWGNQLGLHSELFKGH